MTEVHTTDQRQGDIVQMRPITLLSRLKMYKLLFRTVLILLVLTLCAVGCSYLLIREQVIGRYEQRAQQDAVAGLERVGLAVDQRLENLVDRADALWQADSISSLVVTPERPSFTRIADAAQLIQRFRAENPLVSRCFLYLYGSGQLLSDRQQLLHKDQFSAPEELELLIDLARDAPQTLVCVNGKIYQLLTFPEPKKLGLLLIELDREEFFALVQGAVLPQDPIYVYTRDMVPVFSQSISYPDRDALTVRGDGVQQQVYPQYGDPNTAICLYRAPGSGWHYLSVLSQQAWLPAPGEILHSFLPVAGVLSLLIVVLAWVILHTVYRPIQKVVQSMLLGQDGPAEHRDEAELIRLTLSSHQEENQRLSGLLADVRPALTERFFQSVLSQARTDPAALAELMGTLDLPFPLEGDYLLVLAEPVLERTATELERELYLRSLRHVSAAFWQERCLAQIQMTGERQLACILCCPQQGEMAALLTQIPGYRQRVQHCTRDLPFVTVLGTSQVYHRLLDLPDALRQARQGLNYQRYCLGRSTADTGHHPFDPRACAGEIPEMLRLASHGQLPQAQARLTELRAELAQALDQKQAISVIRDSFLMEVFRLHRELGEEVAAQWPADCPEGLDCMVRALPLVDAWGENSQLLYLERAKGYIKTHYADSDLSLNEVSQYVGLSPTYFSTLFSKYQPVGFADHLRQYRIEQARLLLLSTNGTVAEIGYQTGFNSSNSFIRAFKAQIGDTPGKYRETARLAVRTPPGH